MLTWHPAYTYSAHMQKHTFYCTSIFFTGEFGKKVKYCFRAGSDVMIRVTYGHVAVTGVHALVNFLIPSNVRRNWREIQNSETSVIQGHVNVRSGQVWGHTPEQRVAASTLRRYSFGLRLAIVQADARPVTLISLKYTTPPDLSWSLCAPPRHYPATRISENGDTEGKPSKSIR